MSTEWRSMSEQEKAPWVELAEQEKIAHQKKYPDYKFQPQSKEQKDAKKASELEAKKIKKLEDDRKVKRQKTSEASSFTSGNHIPYEAAAAAQARSTVHTSSPNTYPPTPLIIEAPLLTRSPESSTASLSNAPSALPSPHLPLNVSEPQWLDPTLDPTLGTVFGMLHDAPITVGETYPHAFSMATVHKRSYDEMVSSFVLNTLL